MIAAGSLGRFSSLGWREKLDCICQSMPNPCHYTLGILPLRWGFQCLNRGRKCLCVLECSPGIVTSPKGRVQEAAVLTFNITSDFI